MPGGHSLCSWGRSGAGMLRAMAPQHTVCSLNLEEGTDVSTPVWGGTQQQPAPAKAHFLLLWARSQHTSCKKSDINIFSFVVHSTSMATIQLCHCSTNCNQGLLGQWERLDVNKAMFCPRVVYWASFSLGDLGVVRPLRWEETFRCLVPIHIKGDQTFRGWASQSTCGIQATAWSIPRKFLNNSQVTFIPLHFHV